jgi:hypothetical protein
MIPPPKLTIFRINRIQGVWASLGWRSTAKPPRPHSSSSRNTDHRSTTLFSDHCSALSLFSSPDLRLSDFQTFDFQTFHSSISAFQLLPHVPFTIQPHEYEEEMSTHARTLKILKCET